MAVNSIAAVIDRLDEVIEQARQQRSRLGYFAALYRQVTLQVQAGIVLGRFDDGSRMETFDAAFANRYFSALERFQRGESTSTCWRIAFEAAERWRPLVLQHLLLGMNAHINLDLGAAAASVAPGSGLQGLKNDFFAINSILSQLLDVMQARLGAISPLLQHLDRIGGRTDEAVFNFSMRKARDAAWRTAMRLAPLDTTEQAVEIVHIDHVVQAIGRLIRSPGPLVSTGAFFIRLFESDDVATNIEILNTPV